MGANEPVSPTLHVAWILGISVRVPSSRPFERFVARKLWFSAYHGASNDEPGTKGCAVLCGDVAR